MTEAEWLACRNPHGLLDFFREASDRKVRLFAAACCRRTWPLLIDNRSREAIEASERFADGLATTGELLAAARDADAVGHEHEPGIGPVVAANAATAAALATRQPTRYDPEFHLADHQLVAETIALAGLGRDEVAKVYIDPEITNDFYKTIHEEKAVQARLLRDILRIPFRPIAADPAWLSPVVFHLAQAAYEERALPSGELDPARLAVLADALEEASCTNADILDHLRSPGPHVRGCWALDLVLGKE